MATMLEKQRLITSNVQNPDRTTVDQVLSRIALAPRVARLALTLSKVGDCQRRANLPGRKDHILAGSDELVDAVERALGGRRVTGSWPFATGCQNAEWIAGTWVSLLREFCT